LIETADFRTHAYVRVATCEYTDAQMWDTRHTLLVTVFQECSYTHLVTHLVWPHQPENSPGRRRAQRISPWRSPFLFPQFCLGTPWTHWCWKHQLPSDPAGYIWWLLSWRKILTAVPCTPKFSKFPKWPLVPFILSSRPRVKSSFSLILDNPLHV